MQHKAYEWLARAGYAAEGCVYVIMGGLAVLAALGAGGRVTGAKGALVALLSQPFGFVLLGSRLWPGLLDALENCAIDSRCINDRMASRSSRRNRGRSGAAPAVRGKDSPGTTQGRPRHDLWTKLRAFRSL
jgi:hypothetical protein